MKSTDSYYCIAPNSTGTPQGPYTRQEIKTMRAKGEIGDKHLVAKEGWTDWRTVEAEFGRQGNQPRKRMMMAILIATVTLTSGVIAWRFVSIQSASAFGSKKSSMRFSDDVITPLKSIDIKMHLSSLLCNQNAPDDLRVKFLTSEETDVRAAIARVCGKCDALSKLSSDAEVDVRMGVATNESTPPSVLIKLASDDNIDVRRAVAGNEKSPQDALMTLAADADNLIQLRLSSNKSATPPVLLKMAKNGPYSVALTLFNENLPEKYLKAALESDEISFRRAAAMNPNAPRDIMKRMADDPFVLPSVAENPSVSVQFLEWCSTNVYSEARKGVAKNKKCPPDILKLLSKDSDTNVIKAVADNENTPASALAELARSSNLDVRMHVAKHINTPVSALRELASDSDENIRWRVANSANATADLLEMMVADPSARVRECIASNPNTPENLIKKLAMDPNKDVRGSILKNPAIPGEILQLLAESTLLKKNDSNGPILTQKEGSGNSIEDLRVAADQGDASAQIKLALMYYGGESVPQDYAKAAKCFRMVADQGVAIAQKILGDMYRIGQGVPQDYAEAIKWYHMAANQGEAHAQTLLGNMYNAGQGVPQDYAEAVKWYRMAANQRHAMGQFKLALMYFKGCGVPQDDAEAAKWCSMAADQGNALSQFMLGQMYANGRGVPKDDAEAYARYAVAAALGQKEAVVFREKFAGMLGKDITVAKRRVKEILAAIPKGKPVYEDVNRLAQEEAARIYTEKAKGNSERLAHEKAALAEAARLQEQKAKEESERLAQEREKLADAEWGQSRKNKEEALRMAETGKSQATKISTSEEAPQVPLAIRDQINQLLPSDPLSQKYGLQSAQALLAADFKVKNMKISASRLETEGRRLANMQDDRSKRFRLNEPDEIVFIDNSSRREKGEQMLKQAEEILADANSIAALKADFTAKVVAQVEPLLPDSRKWVASVSGKTHETDAKFIATEGTDSVLLLTKARQLICVSKKILSRDDLAYLEGQGACSLPVKASTTTAKEPVQNSPFGKSPTRPSELAGEESAKSGVSQNPFGTMR